MPFHDWGEVTEILPGWQGKITFGQGCVFWVILILEQRTSESWAVLRRSFLMFLHER